jgi:AcrR family transcriptional regulator
VSNRLPAEKRRRQLLDTAITVFAERGFHATSMNEVAQRAGVTKPVLYQHFRSKRALYLELLDDIAERLEEVIAKAAAAASGPREQVEAGFAAYFRYAEAHQPAFRLLFGFGTRHDDQFAAVTQRVESTIAATVGELIDIPTLSPAGRTLLAHGVVGMAETTCRNWLAGRLAFDGSIDELAARVAGLAWSGLRGVS